MSNWSTCRLQSRSGVVLHDFTCVRAGLEGVLTDPLGLESVRSLSGISDEHFPVREPLPSLILIGSEFSGCSGLSLIERQLETAPVPCVLVTEWLCADYSRLARDVGAMGVVCLSFDLERVLSALRTVLAGQASFPDMDAPLPDHALGQEEALLLEMRSRGQEPEEIACHLRMSRKTIANRLSRVTVGGPGLAARWTPPESTPSRSVKPGGP